MPEKLYYSIGEVAEMFHVNQSLIRFWEKEFDMIKPHKNKRGDRDFTRNDINTLQSVYMLVKEQGYTLQGAKEQLRHGKGEVETKAELLKALNKIRTELMRIQDGL